MARTKSSSRWLDRHFSDTYVRRAQVEGYRSRAAYKLLEIQEKNQVLAPGMRVIDLGAAPGSWSQVAAGVVGKAGCVFAMDILPMEPIPGVLVVQGDFREEEPALRLREALAGDPVDLVLSDMAPNVSGIPAVDQPRMMCLCELAFDLGCQVLKPGGALVVKSFQGEGFDAYLRALRGSFDLVKSRKPSSSRPESRELYLVARGYSL